MHHAVQSDPLYFNTKSKYLRDIHMLHRNICVFLIYDWVLVRLFEKNKIKKIEVGCENAFFRVCML